MNKYQISDDFVKQIIRYAFIENTQEKLDDNELLAFKDEISLEVPENKTEYFTDNLFVKNHLKALIAQNIYGIDEYYQVLNTKDELLSTALDLINNDLKYKNLLRFK